eukprot:GFUD01015863.1.p1 GENE.GFUD01015863.1~~GFUD01015863.1.p1  ORF type:complete len:204 (-),score=62.43 GFUD01015863.1:185-769(-)
MGSKNGKPVLREQDIALLCKSSGLDEAQVKEAFDGFIAEHPNGKMKPKDFKEIITKALPGKDGAKMEKHVFRIYDSNNDGYIDFAEFMIIYIVMSDGSPEEVLAKIFRIYDLNSDGAITKKEMKKIVKDMYGLLKSDNSNVAAEALIAKNAHAEMDKDMDGKITLEEFSTACMGQEEISKMLTLKLVDIFVEDQ